MSIEELGRLTGDGMDRTIANLRSIGLHADAAELEGVRLATLGPKPASSHVAGVQMSYRAGWFSRACARVKGARR